jgi:hypothetical protein
MSNARCEILAAELADHLKTPASLVRTSRLYPAIKDAECACRESTWAKHQAFSVALSKVTRRIEEQESLFREKPHLKTLGLTSFLEMETALKVYMGITLNPSLNLINLWRRL